MWNYLHSERLRVDVSRRSSDMLSEHTGRFEEPAHQWDRGDPHRDDPHAGFQLVYILPSDRSLRVEYADRSKEYGI